MGWTPFVMFACLSRIRHTYAHHTRLIMCLLHNAQTGGNSEVRLRLRRRSWQCALGSLDCICYVTSLDAAYMRPDRTAQFQLQGQKPSAAAAHISVSFTIMQLYAMGCQYVVFAHAQPATPSKLLAAASSAAHTRSLRMSVCIRSVLNMPIMWACPLFRMPFTLYIVAPHRHMHAYDCLSCMRQVNEDHRHRERKSCSLACMWDFH